MQRQTSTNDIRFRRIGVIHSPHTDPEKTPIQPTYAAGVCGRVELFAEYSDGLRDLEGFSHIYLFYVFDRARDPRLIVQPYLDPEERGVFSTRAPCRPNPLGLSLVRLVRREGAILHVEDLDVLDGTPLLDIKPFLRQLDSRDDARSGWFEGVDEATARRLGTRRH
jgi:tRNA-Thr(GGU) m(6)t(6)A37 methyltransferase TsaA